VTKQIFRIAKKTLKVKIANKSRSRFFCILEYFFINIKIHWKGRF